MVRTTVGTIAEAELSVQESESVTTITADQTTTVASSSRERTTVTASTGTLLTVQGLRLNVGAPSGATSGVHQFRLRDPNTGFLYIRARSGNNEGVSINRNTITQANTIQEPASTRAQQANIQAITIDDTTQLEVVYTNSTDVDQSNTRLIRLIGVERGVTN